MELGAMIMAGLALLIALALLLLLLTRQDRARPGVEHALDARLGEIVAAQNEIAGRFGQAIDSQAKTQSELQKTLAERLEALDQRLGTNLKENAAKTAETLGGLQTRLKVIDEAQKNLTDLSGQMVTLQHILSDKQRRGAYGQGNMENIIRDALPNGSYEFQATLSNRKRPDCLIHLPGSPAAIVIDSKFPLEAFELLKNASSDLERKAAGARIKNDVMLHVATIAENYLIAGETQDPAIMFVPSESIYAELHDSFPELIQRAHRSRVVVVSPNILLLAINTVQTVLKDARMREQADLVQREVGLMLRDVGLLEQRVQKLQTHFGQAEGDLKDVLTSTERITKRAGNIEKVELQAIDVKDVEPPNLPLSANDES
ncbi:MAG: DNA recombination protein RmuC [Micropepsaceae bacterium]